MAWNLWVAFFFISSLILLNQDYNDNAWILKIALCVLVVLGVGVYYYFFNRIFNRKENEE